MRRHWVIAGLVLAFFIVGSWLLYEALLAPEPKPPVVLRPPEPVPDTSGYISFSLRPGVTPIGMFWRDDSERQLRTISALRAYLERKGERLRFAMNGGMYHKDRSPVGLFIQDGKVLKPLDTSEGKGNFYLKPNGVFLVRKDHTAAVVTTEKFVYSSDIAFATQSGPMLLIDGAIHPVFEPVSTHLNIRNGVGVRPDGTVIFAISRQKVTLHDFASYFKSLGCRNALYLDGFVSRCYLPEKNCMHLDGDFGVMIGVVE